MPTKTLNGSQGALTLHEQDKWAQLVNFLIITGASLRSISGLIYPIPEGTRAIAQDLQRERNRLEKTKVIDAPEIIQNSITDSIAFLEKQLSLLQLDINNHINRYPKLQADSELLNSIPAVDPQVRNHMLSEIHNHSFQIAEQVAALVPQRVYLGLVP